MKISFPQACSLPGYPITEKPALAEKDLLNPVLYRIFTTDVTSQI